MTQTQKLTIKASEIRSKLMDLSRKDGDQNAAIKALETQLSENEAKLRAAIKAEGTETRSSDGGEERAIQRLSDRANAGSIFLAAIESRNTEGAEAEIQAHFKIPAHSIPLSMLESRAVATVPADVSSTPGATVQNEILQPVFSMGDAAFLNVSQPRVARPGQASFPVLTSAPSVRGPFTGNDSAAETTGTFEASLLEPNRIQAAFSFRRTDQAKMPGMDAALRLALASGLSEKLDEQLISQIVSDTTRVAQATTDTYASYVSRLVFSLLDGRYVSQEAEIRLLMGSETVTDAAVLYRGNNSSVNVIEKIRTITGGLRVSPHIAAASGNKQDVIVRLGSRADIVNPIWEGVALVVDEVTQIAKGAISVTGIMLTAWSVVRAGGVKRIETKHS